MPLPPAIDAVGISTIAIPSPRRRSSTPCAGGQRARDSRPRIWDLDHDHYGGRAAVEALARRAAIGPGAGSSTCARAWAAPPASSPRAMRPA
jgi:hypothetical protein